MPACAIGVGRREPIAGHDPLPRPRAASDRSCGRRGTHRAANCDRGVFEWKATVRLMPRAGVPIRDPAKSCAIQSPALDARRLRRPHGDHVATPATPLPGLPLCVLFRLARHALTGAFRTETLGARTALFGRLGPAAIVSSKMPQCVSLFSSKTLFIHLFTVCRSAPAPGVHPNGLLQRERHACRAMPKGNVGQHSASRGCRRGAVVRPAGVQTIEPAPGASR
jgi:hypothetical protein